MFSHRFLFPWLLFLPFTLNFLIFCRSCRRVSPFPPALWTMELGIWDKAVLAFIPEGVGCIGLNLTFEDEVSVVLGQSRREPYPIPGSVQGWVGQGLRPPGMVAGHGTRWASRSLPTQTILGRLSSSGNLPVLLLSASQALNPRAGQLIPSYIFI